MPEVKDFDACCFCGQSKVNVRKLIGEHGAICDRCVALCYHVLEEEGLEMSFGKGSALGSLNDPPYGTK